MHKSTIPAVIAVAVIGMFVAGIIYVAIPSSIKTKATAPTAPQNLVATPAMAEVDLTWTAPASNGGGTISNYNVYKGTSSGTETLWGSTGSGSQLSEQVAPLTPGTTYYFQVAAFNSAGTGMRSLEVIAVPLVQTPSAPQSIVFQRTGSGKITLFWQAPLNAGEGVSNYKIYRGTSPGGEMLVTTIGNVLTYQNTGLSNGQVYYFQVSASNAWGEGPKSSEISASPAASNPDIGYLYNIRTYGYNNEAWIHWTGTEIANVQFYKIYKNNPGVYQTFVLPSITTYTDTTVLNGGYYYYWIDAVNTNGVESDPNLVEADIYATNGPSWPTITSTINGIGQVTLTWTAPDIDGGSAVTGYNVYYGPHGSYPLTPISIGNVLTYAVTGLSAGQQYDFAINGINAYGNGALSFYTTGTALGVPGNVYIDTATSGNAQVMLAWEAAYDAGSTITNYKIYQGTTSGGETLLATIGNVLAYTATGLTNGQAYYYEVSAVNAQGEGPLSSEASQVPGKPPAPTSVIAYPNDMGEIDLTWGAPPNNGGMTITGYRIYYSQYSGNEIYDSQITLGNVLGYSFTGLPDATWYYFQIAAINGAGIGILSSEASAKTWQIPGPSTAAISNEYRHWPGEDLSTMQIVISWNLPPVYSPPVSYVNIYRGTSPGGGTFLIQQSIGNYQYYDDTAIIGTKYYYRTSLWSTAGEGPLSMEVAITAVPPQYGGSPDAPASLTATGHPGYMTLSWTKPASNDGMPIIGYQIWRSTSSGNERFYMEIGDVTMWNDMGLVHGQKYYYYMYAITATKLGAYSSEVSATVSLGVPGSPTSVVATAGNAQVQLTWNAAQNGGGTISNYKIYRGIMSGAETPLTTIGNVLAYQDTGLTNGQAYYYEISAVNQAGEGTMSSEISVIPATVPSAPTGLVANGDNITIYLSWAVPPSNGGSAITGYNVYRGTSSGNEISYATGVALPYTDTAVVGGTTYYYQISAVNVMGEGTKSTELSILSNTIPGAPRNFAAIGHYGYITLTWKKPIIDGGTPITIYKIFRGTSSGYEMLLTTYDTNTNGGTRVYIDSDVSSGQPYYYTILAVGSSDGVMSVEASAMTLTLPGSPTITDHVIGNGIIIISWTVPADNGGAPINGYTVYRGTASGGETSVATLGNVLSYIDTTVSGGTIYYYQVTATTEAGEGPRSTELAVMGTSIPGKPLNVHFPSVGYDFLTIAWDAPASNGGSTITSYDVFRGTASGSETSIATVSGTTFSYGDTGLTNGLTYYYKIRATNAIGIGQLSDEATVAPGLTPTKVLSLQATAGTRLITLAWDVPASDGGFSITNYKIYRGTSPGSETLLTTMDNVLAYEDDGLTGGQAYYYQVSAVNVKGDGTPSDEASATPIAVPSTIDIMTPTNNAFIEASPLHVEVHVTNPDDIAMVIATIKISGTTIATQSLALTGGTPKDGIYAGNVVFTGSNGPCTLEIEAQISFGDKTFATMPLVIDINDPSLAVVTPLAGFVSLDGTITPSTRATEVNGISSVTASYLTGMTWSTPVMLVNIGGTYLATIPIAFTIDGQVSFKFIATSSTGRTTIVIVSGMIDVSSPVITIDTFPADGGRISSSTVPVSLHCTDGNGIQSVIVNFQNDVKTYSFIIPSTGSNVYSSSIHLPSGIVDGTYTATIVATDMGNRITTITRTIHVDLHDPVISITKPTSNQEFTSQTTFAVTVEASVVDEATVTVTATISNSTWISSEITLVLESGTINVYSGTFTSIQLYSGIYTISVVATSSTMRTATASVDIVTTYTPAPPQQGFNLITWLIGIFSALFAAIMALFGIAVAKNKKNGVL